MNRIGKIALTVVILTFISCQQDSPSLSTAKPQRAGLSADHLSLLDGLINNAIKNKEFPGADILVARKGKIIFRKVYGNSQWIPDQKPMRTSMMFDLASITKPVATATSILILVERGKIRLWDKVKDYIPEFSPYVDEENQIHDDARLWHLLTHTSGLPPYCNTQEVEDKYGSPCPVELLVEFIGQMEKLNPPGEEFHYSCLGFITLALIIKKVSGETVAEFSKKHIFEPMEMNHTCYIPSESLHELCVPTEVIDGEPLVGTVHDPLARLQGGISGNAGLFSTADDLAVFAQMMLNKGRYGKKRILSPLTVARMTSVYPNVVFAGRGLGWDLDSSYSTNSGDLFGPLSFGHTGYTGTSIWIDPETQSFVIFLTNRVHPDDDGAVAALRSKVANVVASSIR
ncbi:MAG: serine hydrolase [Candidatus Aminicenantes bacterium]|jgi:CubicO group peptidase (beta-lactamase class C family)